MDFRRADLHTHTYFSDGRLSPTELVRKARQHGMHALSITDHDTISGLPEGFEAGRKYGVEMITGVELSVTVDDQEVHILGYFFDTEHTGLRQHLDVFQKQRHKRALEIVRRLNGLGIPLDFEGVLKQAQYGLIGRPHVAMAMVEDGIIPSYQDAFTTYLKDGGPAFIAKPLFPAGDALALLHDAGGIGVFAHPGHWTSERVVKKLIMLGLDGIETIHPGHDYILTRYYRQITCDHMLIETGGSDYHGLREDEDENMGRYSIPYAQLAYLRPT